MTKCGKLSYHLEWQTIPQTQKLTIEQTLPDKFEEKSKNLDQLLHSKITNFQSLRGHEMPPSLNMVKQL